ncbi:MAG: hypothetical protein ACLQVM_06775, partial [Terriglobia bacterium]
ILRVIQFGYTIPCMARPSLLKLSEGDARQLREAAANSAEADFTAPAVRLHSFRFDQPHRVPLSHP